MINHVQKEIGDPVTYQLYQFKHESATLGGKPCYR